MKNLRLKLQELKAKIGLSIPIPDNDKLKHTFVTKWFIRLIVLIAGIAFPLIGILLLLGFLFLAALWELPQLIDKKFSDEAKKEALQDWLAAFDESFNVLVLLIFIYTTR